ncbi:MAG: Gfo/Idh/MocA family oxidoreductase [Planctomycetes bacterium]|nr:Gfo/Idh/MocA family oxidoreductase [Planctomycetota bacterium]
MAERTNRRAWLARAAAGAGAALAGRILAARSPEGANDRIALGSIGVAGRGRALLKDFMSHQDVAIGAVCDVYETHLRAAVKQAGDGTQGFKDYRRLLDRRDIDAVVIATPTHWHAIPAIHACQAGKDVYVEKPLAHNIAEGRAIVRAARAAKRVTQMGIQIHASENYRRVVEIVRSGILGKIAVVRTWLVQNETPDGIGRPSDADPPADLDWDMWLGPAPDAAYNPARFSGGKFRYFWDYGGGWPTAMGPHIVDLPVWALELEAPDAVAACGGKHVLRDLSETPDTLEAVYDLPGLTMTWSNSSVASYAIELKDPAGIRRRLGVVFQGTNGTLAADYNRFELLAEGSRVSEKDLPEPSLPPSPGHQREFLDAIRSRARTSCDVEYGHKVTAFCHLANIAFRSGRKIRWDGAAERVLGDDGADRLVRRTYRAPWTLPPA